MNGLSSTLKDEIKKGQESKQKEKFKFIIALLLTNIAVAILCLPAHEKNTETPPLLKQVHPQYKMMTLPLSLLASDTNLSLSEVPVTIIGKDKKVIARKAFIHSLAQTKGDNSYFKIEINEQDIVQVSENIDSIMVAVPYVGPKEEKHGLKKGSKYEVNF